MPQTGYSSLPTYRPLIRLGAQMQLQLIGGTRIQFLPVGPEGVLGAVVEYGRLVIENPKEGGTPLRLQVGDRRGTVTLADLGSGLAIEVGRASASGADPETQPSPLTADLYVTSGKVFWQEGGQRDPVVLEAPVRLTFFWSDENRWEGQDYTVEVSPHGP